VPVPDVTITRSFVESAAAEAAVAHPAIRISRAIAMRKIFLAICFHQLVFPEKPIYLALNAKIFEAIQTQTRQIPDHAGIRAWGYGGARQKKSSHASPNYKFPRRQ
jgi:hypothetical protein